MAIYERWAYIDSLYYKNDNSYQNVYNIILNEINNGTSPDGSLNSRIGYLNTLLKYLASSNAMTIE
jgi:PHP family Zn ribbon phosphoesterase